jgi:hypothetical protein
MRRAPGRLAAKIALWVLGIPAVLLIVLYLVLLITPIRLPFGGAAAQAAVAGAMPESIRIELGDVALALEGGIWPVLQFSPVTLDDVRSGAHIEMEALRVGFSPWRSLLGQPGASVTVLAPRLQIVQDLFGPRPTRFELVEDPLGGTAMLRVIEGLDAFPTISISEDGVQLDGLIGAGGERTMRSDNEWLVYNLQASEIALRDVIEQTRLGRFSRLVVRDAHIDMSDSIYGLMRSFTDVSLDLRPQADGRVRGQFRATLAGRTMTGVINRNADDAGNSRLQADITNIDFASFLPFLDDPDSVVAVRGAGQVSIDVGFDAEDADVSDGAFRVDMTGLDLRIRDDHYPIASSIMEVAWEPDTGTFTMEEGALQVADSSAYVSGIFRLGLDETYGPTIAMSVSARDLVIAPYDMEPPEQPFDSVEFVGWSAPLYGAMGIDRLVANKGEGRIETAGRIDMLRAGLGFDISVAGQGITADDLKRLWPSIMGGESRDWFVANVTEGTVARSTMRFNFPVGTIGLDGESAAPLPDGAMLVEIVGTEVAIRPTPAMEPIALEGELLFKLDDADMSVSASGGVVPTENGPIRVSSPAILMDNSGDGPGIFEVSGDISAGIPALVALIKQQQPEALADAELPVDIDAITGSVDLGLLATIRLADEAAGEELKLDYVLNGTVSDFGSEEPIADRRISGGQLQFSASQEGFQLGGTANLDGMEAEVEIVGAPEADPVIRLASTVRVADLASMGFDASEFLTGQVRFVAQPLTDERLAISIDLERAGVTIADLGISKSVGTPGSLNAVIAQDGEETSLTDISLRFGDVELAGGLVYHAETGLRAAEFTQVKLSPGDNAQASLAPISGGYAVNLRGSQLDLKPVLRRFFSLGEGSGGVSTEQFDQTLDLTVRLDRAVGFYGTTAYNVEMDMLLAGSDLRRANLAASFTQGNAIAITTNPTPEGRIMSVAFNDLGTILRLIGVYSQLAGGSGSLVLNRNTAADIEAGELTLSNFAIVDEQNVAQILGNHANSRTMIAERNRLDFDNARVQFTRSGGRIEVTQAMLSGDMVGGTMRGFVHTDTRQYDLTGTYVPLFGLNNAFQQIPLFGPILGGRQGEGLFGVTFAVRGPLDNPQFRINPLSALVPGAFRELFEFRAQTGRPGGPQ